MNNCKSRVFPFLHNMKSQIDMNFLYILFKNDAMYGIHMAVLIIFYVTLCPL
jgi:hypothetical protein